MRILHLSDTHLYADPSARHYDRIDTTAALQGLLARFAALPPIDAIVHTGDASEDGTAGSYQLLHEILDPFAAAHGATLAVAMGNHDASATHAEATAPGDRGTVHQDRVVPLAAGGRIVVLDSSVPGAGYGHLETEQLTWLREVLAEPAPIAADGTGPGTVLAIHHPPLVAATPMLRALDLDGLEALAEILSGTDVQVVLSGHYHHVMSGGIAGIPVHVVPGITNVVDVVAAGGKERSLALSGAGIVELGQGAPRVLTSVYPNAGDTLADPQAPVYEFGPEQVAAIIESAGR